MNFDAGRYGTCIECKGAITQARGVPLASAMRELRRRQNVAMTRYVIDAPTLLHLAANGIQVNPRHQLVAPNLIRSQALSLLLAAVRRGELTEELALQHHERITELKIRLLGDRVSCRTAWRIAREQDWATTYDAEYLAVTKLQADALVTVEPALAAKAKDVVPLAGLDALIAS